MNNEIKLPPDCLGFYCIPLDEESCSLSLEVLNQHSEFRQNTQRWQYYRVNYKAFDFGILRMEVVVDRDSPSQNVYLFIKNRQLYVTCDAGTDQSFLSRHAYFALSDNMYSYSDKDFKKFDWFDFFETGSKKSTYLDVIFDRAGLDIDLKKKYRKFWKWGDVLFKFHTEEEISRRIKPLERVFNQGCNNNVENEAVGYFVAIPDYHWCNEWSPLLVPYIGQLNKARTDFRIYTKMLTKDDLHGTDWTDQQSILNSFGYKMVELTNRHNSFPYVQNVTSFVSKCCVDLFVLWHQAWAYLILERFTKIYSGTNRGGYHGKPYRQQIHQANLSATTPKICFELKDRKDYYELLMRVKIDKRVFTPKVIKGMFFTTLEEQPDSYYLWDSVQDLRLAVFLKSYAYGFSVLKTHYEGTFAVFVKELRRKYEFL